MTDESIVPGVPDVRGRNRRRVEDQKEVDGDTVREDVDAFEREAPFVPLVARRREERLGDVVAGEADD